MWGPTGPHPPIPLCERRRPGEVRAPSQETAMAIIRIYTGQDGKSHFEEIVPRLSPRGDQSDGGELFPGSGILIRRFDTKRTNPWHHAPGRAAVFTLSGAVDIEIGDGTVQRLGPGDVRIAEDRTGQGHVTREVGPEPRVSIFVPLT